MTCTFFTNTEEAVQWSEAYSSQALLCVENLQSAIDVAEALGYCVNYSEVDKDLCDDRETYDFWGAKDPESEEINWRLKVKIEHNA